MTREHSELRCRPSNQSDVHTLFWLLDCSQLTQHVRARAWTGFVAAISSKKLRTAAGTAPGTPAQHISKHYKPQQSFGNEHVPSCSIVLCSTILHPLQYHVSTHHSEGAPNQSRSQYKLKELTGWFPCADPP